MTMLVERPTFEPPPEPDLRFTPEDLQRLPEEQRFELVNGRLVERNMSVLSSDVASEMVSVLRPFVRQRGLGRAFAADLGYQCFPDDPLKVRKPDVSFVSASRWSDSFLSRGYCPIAPDLVVGVVSKHDLHEEVQVKVGEYLEAGVRVVWVIDPGARCAQMYGADGSSRRLTAGGTLEGGEVVPGFQCPLAALLPGGPGKAGGLDPE